MAKSELDEYFAYLLSALAARGVCVHLRPRKSIKIAFNMTLQSCRYGDPKMEYQSISHDKLKNLLHLAIVRELPKL